MIGIQQDEILVDDLLRAVRSARSGAVALFLGTVRDHNRGRKVLHLEYQAYAEMAESELRKLAAEAERRFEISDVALLHRTGRLELGEISVAVAVAAPHRDRGDRGLPLRDRHAQADRPDLEEGSLRRWRGLDRGAGRDALGEAGLFQIVFLEPEVVAQLVVQRDANLLRQLGGPAHVALEVALEQVDPRR